LSSQGLRLIDAKGTVLPYIPMHYFILAEECYGINKELNNQTFWKSFERVRDMDPYEYYSHQLMHYFSTYGMEMIGLKARSYVPLQDLEIPDTWMPYKRLTVIRFVSKEDGIELINHYVLVTNAPSAQRIEQFKPLMEKLTIKTDEIKSFELQVIKHDMDGTVPAAPQSFLRFLVYKTTGSTLLIKNRATRKAIQNAALDYHKAHLPYELLSKADISGLASIFFRYRPIFLAFKTFDGCAPIINRIRRLADRYHVPMSDVSVQNFITLVRQNRRDGMEMVIKEASNRELVKLANFLFTAHTNAHQSDTIPGVYNIRNGRTFVRADKPTHSGAETSSIWYACCRVVSTLKDRLSEKLRGKKFYIPNYINYAAPVSEKQFIGNIPWGSSLSGFNDGDAFTTGIAWMNQDGCRVDIDLHLNSATRHFGWNSGYTDGENIIYTGDQTDAPEPRGAAEAYYFKPGDETFVLSANLFSGVEDMPYKMFMTSRKPAYNECPNRWERNHSYTFDPADAMFAPIPLKFNGSERDMTIGLFYDNRFYFYGGSANKGIVPSANYADYIKGLTAKFKPMLNLTDLFGLCGAEVINDKKYADLDEEERKEVISLAPEDLTATTLLDIVDGNI